MDVHAQADQEVAVRLVLALGDEQVNRVPEAVGGIVEGAPERRPRRMDQDGRDGDQSWLVQCGQRVAASGISVAQNGQDLVVASACAARRASIAVFGRTTTK